MDSTDYVNVYIDTLSKKLHEEINKNLMHESKIVILERANADLVNQLQLTQQELDKYKKKKGGASPVPLEPGEF